MLTLSTLALRKQFETHDKARFWLYSEYINFGYRWSRRALSSIKQAVILGSTKTLARELSNIRGIAPGVIDTARMQRFQQISKRDCK